MYTKTIVRSKKIVSHQSKRTVKVYPIVLDNLHYEIYRLKRLKSHIQLKLDWSRGHS